MVLEFPVVVCFVGAISWFWLMAKLRGFKVPEKPRPSRSHLSQQERQRKVVVGSWIAFTVACVLLAGGFVLFWLENSS